MHVCVGGGVGSQEGCFLRVQCDIICIMKYGQFVCYNEVNYVCGK